MSTLPCQPNFSVQPVNTCKTILDTTHCTQNKDNTRPQLADHWKVQENMTVSQELLQIQMPIYYENPMTNKIVTLSYLPQAAVHAKNATKLETSALQRFLHGTSLLKSQNM